MTSPSDVHDYLARTYPARRIGWARHARWDRARVPLEHIQMARRIGGARDPARVAAIEESLQAGERPDPVVLVRRYEDEPYRVADGFHRLLALRHLGRATADAHVGHVEEMPDLEAMHAGKLNKASALAMGWEEGSPEPGDRLLTLVKQVGEEADHYTLGVAYPADFVDAHGNFADPRDLELAAWHFMAVHRTIDIQHTSGTEGHGTVVESYIYRGPDWKVTLPGGKTFVVKPGDWLLGVIWDDAAWPMIQRRLIRGWSVYGRYSPEKAAAPAPRD